KAQGYWLQRCTRCMQCTAMKGVLAGCNGATSGNGCLPGQGPAVRLDRAVSDQCRFSRPHRVLAEARPDIRLDRAEGRFLLTGNTSRGPRRRGVAPDDPQPVGRRDRILFVSPPPEALLVLLILPALALALSAPITLEQVVSREHPAFHPASARL